MASYKKEYPYSVEDIVTECDIYTAEGHKFHTERAISNSVHQARAVWSYNSLNKVFA